MKRKKKNRKKINKKHRTIVATLILLLVVFGLLIVSNLFSHDTNSYFARIRVAIKKKVQIVYNQNLFEGNKIDNSGIKEYDSDKQVITFDGKLEGNHINLGTLNVKLKKGERYRVTVNYLSGSYDKNSEPKFIFELQKNGDYYTDRKNGTHYIFEMLPTKKDKPIDTVLTIKDEVVDASNIIYRIYQENEVEFKNYKIQISITKLESKIGVAGEKYGKLPAPEKDGYEFLGWYDSISGGKKITETNTILKKYNHTLYAHWERKEPNYSKFKWTYYSPKTGPAAEYFKYTISYAIWAPDDVKDLNGIKLPILVWLHGGGDTYEKIKNGEVYLNRGFPKMVSEWKLKPIPAIIIAPQAPTVKECCVNSKVHESIRAMVKYVNEKYGSPTDNIALMGHSMGGGGALLINDNMKGFFRTVVPMSHGYSIIGSLDTYKNIRIRGYDEDCEAQRFFDWIGHHDDFTCLKGVSHEDVLLKYSVTVDENNDGVSDLIEWMFEE
jgi:uncharacterized repeat protein (TIGR02543 family)